MRKKLLVVSVLVMVLTLGSAVMAADVTVMGVWGGAELEAFNKVLAAFEDKTGFDAEFEGTRDLPTVITTRLEAGNPPDVVALQGLGMIKDYASRGSLVDLRDVLDVDEIRENFGQSWIDLGSYEEGLYGLYISADVKSFVWYNPRIFAIKGYSLPETWEEMKALEAEMIANGDTPWAVGLESGAASGWPGTDWIEDIMLRTASPEVYDAWVNHDIPWTDPRVKRAFEIFGEIVRDPERVWGGPIAVAATNFGDAVNPLFTDPPQAYMHRQASFITSFIKESNPGLEAGADFDFFPFPAIDEEYGTPVLGAADMMAMMNDTPAAREFVQFLASAEAQSIWVGELGKIGINKNIDPAVYPDDLTRNMAEALQNASVFRFDGSDLMPAAVGAGAFWTGMMDYVTGTDLDSVLEYIEDVADDSYTTGKATN